MHIATTVNLRIDLLDKIIAAKQEFNITLNKIVKIFLSRALKWGKGGIKTFKSVKYQPKKQDINFHKLHINIDQALYERCLDMRKLYKLSVSYILSICIQLYIDSIGQEIENNQNNDNYHDCYLFLCNFEKDVFSFTIFWSLPGKIPIQSSQN